MSLKKTGKTLVIQPLPGIGDMVWHLGILRTLAKSAEGGHVSLLTKPSAQARALLGSEPCVKEVLDLHPAFFKGPFAILKLAQALRSHRFDTVWILHHSALYTLATFLAGIPKRFGYGFGIQRFLLSRGVHPCPAAQHGQKAPYRIEAFLGANSLSEESRFFEKATSQKDQVVFGIGATEPARRWPPAHFAAIIAHIKTPVILCGAPRDLEIAQAIQGLVPTEAPPLSIACNQPLDQSMRLIAESRLFIGNDSGLLNIAAAYGVPSIGLDLTPEVAHHFSNVQGVWPQANGTIADIAPEAVLATYKIILSAGNIP